VESGDGGSVKQGDSGRQPRQGSEIRRTQDGRPIANLSHRDVETWRDKGTGERKEKTDGIGSSSSPNRFARLSSSI